MTTQERDWESRLRCGRSYAQQMAHYYRIPEKALYQMMCDILDDGASLAEAKRTIWKRYSQLEHGKGM